MRFDVWLRGWAALLAVRLSLIAATPHPSRPGRWIEVMDGISIEYSPGQEIYLPEIARVVSAWDREAAERERAWYAKQETEVVALSPRDLRINREEILKKVAHDIGLDAPTRHQEEAYNAFFLKYEQYGTLFQTMTEFSLAAANVRQVQIWARTDLQARLKAGEKIENFSYDAPSDQISFEFNSSMQTQTPPLAPPSDASDLDFKFQLSMADGTSNVAASVTNFNRGAPTGPVPRLPPAPTVAIDRAKASVVVPMVLKADTVGKDPATVVANGLSPLLKDVGSTAAIFNNEWAPPVAHTLLHETIEIGLVDQYLASPDRRWLCEGIANYDAWKIIRDRGGLELANKAYNLDDQLRRYPELQRKINLKRWPAVENQKKEDNQSELNRAHYPFATRAVFMMVQAEGEDFLPKLLREVSKTPKPKASMKTVAAAYHKLTGKKLDDLISAAEKTPIPPAKIESAKTASSR